MSRFTRRNNDDIYITGGHIEYCYYKEHPLYEAIEKLACYEDVEEQKRGRWERKAAYSDGVLNTVACSACGTYQPIGSWDYTNYCPYCGAKMEV